MSKILTFSFVLLLGLAVGCHQESSRAKIYTEAELDRLITPGMSIADVTNRFGQPGSEIQATENSILLTYTFPSEIINRKEGESYLKGFGIDIKDGRVVRWSPVTGPQGSFGAHIFEIFLATDSLTNALKNFESEGSADTSALKISPDMEFMAKIFAGKNECESSNEITVILVMSDQDASKFKDLTENNIGKRTLVVCQNKVIAAPLITAPVNPKQFMFTVKDAHVLDGLRSR